MNPVTWLLGLLPAGSTLTRQDRPRWARADRLEDLGHLMEAWLGGYIASQPGYYGSVDVDEADAPGLTGALITLNRAAIVTRQSQAGTDGAEWVQHAAVEAYTDEESAEQLSALLEGHGFEIRAQLARPPFAPPDEGIAVTFYLGEPCTWFGRAMTKAQVAFDLEGAGRGAVKDAQRALQVTVWDPTPGRNTLWAALQTAGEQIRSRQVAQAQLAQRAAVHDQAGVTLISEAGLSAGGQP